MVYKIESNCRKKQKRSNYLLWIYVYNFFHMNVGHDLFIMSNFTEGGHGSRSSYVYIICIQHCVQM